MKQLFSAPRSYENALFTKFEGEVADTREGEIRFSRSGNITGVLSVHASQNSSR